MNLAKNMRLVSFGPNHKLRGIPVPKWANPSMGRQNVSKGSLACNMRIHQN